MARYKMDDSTIVDTGNATKSWPETTDWNGSNHIGRSSRSQWHDQTLYRSRKGRYYIEYHSREQGIMDRAEWISNRAATLWLLANECDLPDNLKEFEEQITE
jgi:hypothetical protein